MHYVFCRDRVHINTDYIPKYQRFVCATAFKYQNFIQNKSPVFQVSSLHIPTLSKTSEQFLI
jgi:hypothetical protein